MITIILAIDDDPGRYEHLRGLLGDRAKLVFATCGACVAGYLTTAAAVLLDYDLDSGEPCPCCLASFGVWGEVGLKGSRYADRIVRSGTPVIVTSAAGRVADQMAVAMRGAGHSRVARISVVETDPEIRCLGQLWAWGVL